MQELKKLGVRSVIMTSGTLSPMDAFREDMKLPFPVQLENPHVIEKNQVRLYFQQVYMIKAYSLITYF
jgi:regulator of telomere elongation helicase 1